MKAFIILDIDYYTIRDILLWAYEFYHDIFFFIFNIDNDVIAQSTLAHSVENFHVFYTPNIDIVNRIENDMIIQSIEHIEIELFMWFGLKAEYKQSVL